MIRILWSDDTFLILIFIFTRWYTVHSFFEGNKQVDRDTITYRKLLLLPPRVVSDCWKVGILQHPKIPNISTHPALYISPSSAPVGQTSTTLVMTSWLFVFMSQENKKNRKRTKLYSVIRKMQSELVAVFKWMHVTKMKW